MVQNGIYPNNNLDIQSFSHLDMSIKYQYFTTNIRVLRNRPHVNEKTICANLLLCWVCEFSSGIGQVSNHVD